MNLMYGLHDFFGHVYNCVIHTTLTRKKLMQGSARASSGGSGNTLFLRLTNKRLLFFTAAARKVGFLRQPHENKRTLTRDVKFCTSTLPPRLHRCNGRPAMQLTNSPPDDIGYVGAVVTSYIRQLLEASTSHHLQCCCAVEWLITAVFDRVCTPLRDVTRV